MPVFTRFSTVAGGAGSVDTPRDVRGFAVKFYTQEGNWDLVGNNIPVFFIQDAIKFPDLIHAVKMEADRGYPQAGSAHDTFWDWASLMPETTHMLMWACRTARSRARCDDGGVRDPHFPACQCGRQIDIREIPLEAEARHAVDGVGRSPEAPGRGQRLSSPRSARGDRNRRLSRVGTRHADVRSEIRRQPALRRARRDQNHSGGSAAGPPDRSDGAGPQRDNFFAETEQVAYCPANIVPGIDFTNDPLLQGRLFSYLDTQKSRLGTSNFHQLPINAPKCPVMNFQRDGQMQMNVPKGRASYEPNSLGEAGEEAGPRECPVTGFSTFAQVRRPRTSRATSSASAPNCLPTITVRRGCSGGR